MFQRNTLGTRQALIQRAAELEHDNDDKIAGLADAHASAARELARLDGVAPGSADEADVLNAARSQILRTAIEQRIANARGAQAIDLHDRMNDALTPGRPARARAADRRRPRRRRDRRLAGAPGRRSTARRSPTGSASTTHCPTPSA